MLFLCNFLLYLLGAFTTTNASTLNGPPLTIVIAFSVGSRSHVTSYFEASRLLIERGHTVIFASPERTLFFSQDYPYIEQYSLGSNMVDPFDVMKDELNRLLAIDEISIKNTVKISDFLVMGYKEMIESLDVMINKVQPDIILSTLFCAACMDIALDRGIKLGLIGTIPHSFFTSPWYAPPMYEMVAQQDWISNPWRRLQSYVKPLPYLWTLRKMSRRHDLLRKENGLNVTLSYREIFKRVLLICNYIPGLVLPVDLPPNVVAIGPIMPKTPLPMGRTLKEALDDFLDNDINVVYIAFGSVVKSQSELIDKISKSIQISLDRNPNIAFLWSLSNLNSTVTALSGIATSPRVLLSDWVEQKAVLEHPSVKLFVTHGGISSLHESVFYGHPMIVIPFFGDQWSNAARIKDLGLGTFLLKTKFMPDALSDTIQDILEEMNKRPTENSLRGNVEKFKIIARINAQFHTQIVTNAIETAAWVGYDHLIPPYVGLSWDTRYPIQEVCLTLITLMMSWNYFRRKRSIESPSAS